MSVYKYVAPERDLKSLGSRDIAPANDAGSEKLMKLEKLIKNLMK
jgi:hypothetical protein